MPEPTPLLVRRMVVTASTAAPGRTGAALLTGLPASAPGQLNGWAPADVVADRGYSNALPANWHDPLRAAGYALIHDLHPTRQGNTATVDGVVIIDGAAYSPGILNYPDLVHLTPPPIGASRKQLDRYAADIELRRPFLLPRHGITTFGAPVRLACPAVRDKLACPLRGTLGLAISKGVPEVFTPPSAPAPAICTAKVVRLPAGALAHGQDNGLLFGSKAWYDAFHRRRPRVEGENGIVKNPTGPHLAKGRICVRSRAKVSVMVALIVAASNIAAVEAWRATRAVVAKLNSMAAAARRSRRPAGRPGGPVPVRRRPAAARAPAA